MSSIIIKRQLSLTLIVLVLTTVMVAGTIFSASSDTIVFAKKHKHNQKIGQSNEQKQKAVCLTAGANSPISTSCNNSSVSANSNNGGNAAALGGHGDSKQSIGQSNEQKQKAVCLTAGANSPISTSCNNSVVSANSNNGGNAAALGGHGNSNHQKIGQSNEQKQEAVCLTAGANSPISTSCNNAANASNDNNGGNAAA